MTEGLSKMSVSNSKMFSYEKIIEKIEKLRKDNKTFVLTNGCFDILHVGNGNLASQKHFLFLMTVKVHRTLKLKCVCKDARLHFRASQKPHKPRLLRRGNTQGFCDLGHIRYLKEAKKLGDYLIVALNSDKSIKELKGPSRPINNEETRSEILSSLEPIDFVFVFNDKTAENILKKIKPEIYAKGGDYTIDTINQDERKIIEGYSGKIFILKGIPNVSTTKLINQMKS